MFVNPFRFALCDFVNAFQFLSFSYYGLEDLSEKSLISFLVAVVDQCVADLVDSKCLVIDEVATCLLLLSAAAHQHSFRASNASTIYRRREAFAAHPTVELPASTTSSIGR